MRCECDAQTVDVARCAHESATLALSLEEHVRFAICFDDSDWLRVDTYCVNKKDKSLPSFAPR